MSPTSLLLLALLAPPPDPATLEADTLRFVNEARIQPAHFARRYLAPLAKSSPEAEDCLRAMEATKPMPALRRSPILANSARDHARDVASAGLESHVGSDGSTLRERISRYGRFKGYTAENIYFGPADPLQAVLRLLIDPGTTNQLHRLSLLNPDLREAGAAFLPHPETGYVLVLDLATETQPLRP